MSEDQTTPTPGAEANAPDQIQNLKSEFNRKLENLSKTNESLVGQNDALNQKLDTIMGKLETTSAPANVSGGSGESLEDLRYTDPDKYLEIKLKEVDKKVDKKLEQREAINTQKQQVLTQLATDYPEINKADSALYKKAIEISKKYDANFMNSPEGLQLVVREAAAQLGVIPANLRQNSGEEQDMGEFIGSGGSGSGGPKDRKPKEKELDYRTVEFAKRMGLNTDDPKVMESLKKRAQRKNWNRWE